MKIYLSNGSPNCRKVLATAAHLGLDLDVGFDLSPREFFDGALRAPEFLALNPNGRVPTLVDGDFVLWESNAIAQYLCSQTPGQALFPEDARTRAQVVRWQCWELGHFGRWAGELVSERLLKPLFENTPPDPQVVQSLTDRFRPLAEVLNRHLENRAYLVAGRVTLADYAVGSQLTLGDGAPWDIDDYPYIRAWAERLSEDPGWRQSAPRPLVET